MRWTRRRSLIGLLAIGVLAFTPMWCNLFALVLRQTHTVVEQALGETPEAKDVVNTQQYWGAAGAGNPVRRWVLRDVYPVSEWPIAFPWPLPTAVLQPTPGQTAVLPAPKSTPAATALLSMPIAVWITYTNPPFGITLQYPGHWQPKPGYERRFVGPDGFFQLDAISGEAATIDQVTESDAYHKLRPYGSMPKIGSLQVQGLEARLILPSADQPKEMENQAGLIIHLPQPIEITGQWYHYLILWADKNHIREIAQTVKLGMPAAQATPTAY